MRTRSFYGTITAMTIASALTLSAQTPQTPQTQSQTTPRSSGDQRTGSEQTVTVTGCLQQNSAAGMSGAGSTGSTGSAGSPGTATGGSGSTAGSSAGSAGSTGMSGSSQTGASKFVLANAKMAQGSSTSALGTATRFSLSGMSDAELTKHVNHQVEITGRLSAASTSGMASGAHGGAATGTTGAAGTTGAGTTGATGSAGATGSTGTSGRSGSAMGSGAGMNDTPQLHATNLKMISATCPAQQ